VGDRVVNLTFHGVGSCARMIGAGEQEVWLTLPRFLSVLDAVAERRDVALSFDDGNASDVEHALPALRARGLHATFFVVADRLDTSGFLSRDDVRALHAAGMPIGCHGMRHRPWRGLDRRTLDEELVAARALLEEIVEEPVTRASCPFGAYDRRVLAALRRHGYSRIYTSDGGTTAPGAWLQARNSVRWWEGADLLDLIEQGAQRPRARLNRRATLAAKRWR
jgi:peptidoglycan/xylan/chitin deacetylase (PgdA/CDA1 family)